mmetsp:Transcript_12570/g.20341  ORF Transcript_12570/g.20341 Transcript_12570/m.20341 type:complete len:214 (-) Transcript_12570:462-1103(-)
MLRPVRVPRVAHDAVLRLLDLPDVLGHHVAPLVVQPSLLEGHTHHPLAHAVRQRRRHVRHVAHVRLRVHVGVAVGARLHQIRQRRHVASAAHSRLRLGCQRSGSPVRLPEDVVVLGRNESLIPRDLLTFLRQDLPWRAPVSIPDELVRARLHGAHVVLLQAPRRVTVRHPVHVLPRVLVPGVAWHRAARVRLWRGFDLLPCEELFEAVRKLRQ